MTEAFVISALRTAGARKGGKLSGWHPIDLAAATVDAAIQKAKVDPAQIDDVIFGCVTQVGEQAFNIARGVILASTVLPIAVPGTTVDRQCGSSQQAIHFAAQAVMSGTMDVVLAGGVESMTRAPMMSAATLAQAAGLGGPISPGILKRLPEFYYDQIRGAEWMAEKYALSKSQLAQFSFDSHVKAGRATREGWFTSEIVPIPIEAADGSAGVHATDEGIRFEPSIDAINGVKPIRDNGTMSAAFSSQVCDGAAAVVLASERAVRAMGLQPLAAVRHMSVVGSDPVVMLEAPIPATERVLARAGLRISNIDLYEVNEAFASVPLAWLKALAADPLKLNVNGGAIALGHPLGASGAKLAVTLIHALHRTGGRYGLQTMCEGGGMANATIYERV